VGWLKRSRGLRVSLLTPVLSFEGLLNFLLHTGVYFGCGGFFQQRPDLGDLKLAQGARRDTANNFARIF
jgi:hypothetical protein